MGAHLETEIPVIVVCNLNIWHSRVWDGLCANLPGIIGATVIIVVIIIEPWDCYKC